METHIEFDLDNSCNDIVTMTKDADGITITRFPFSCLPQWKSKNTSKKSSVYILMGGPGSNLAYIGTSDDVGTRLGDHLSRPISAGYSMVYIVDSADSRIGTAEMGKIEGMLFDCATSARKRLLANVKRPTARNVGHNVLHQIQRIYGRVLETFDLLGIELFERASVDVAPANTTAMVAIPEHNIQPLHVDNRSKNDGVFYINLGQTKPGGVFHKTMGIILRDGRMLVRTGEKFMASGSLGPQQNATRDALISDGSLAHVPEDSGVLVATKDILFTSPISAACMIRGKRDVKDKMWSDGGSSNLFKQRKAGMVSTSQLSIESLDVRHVVVPRGDITPAPEGRHGQVTKRDQSPQSSAPGVFSIPLGRTGPSAPALRTTGIVLKNGQMLIPKGQHLVDKHGIGPQQQAARKRLEADGSIVRSPDDAGLFIATTDLLFDSPSTAAAMIRGMRGFKDKIWTHGSGMNLARQRKLGRLYASEMMADPRSARHVHVPQHGGMICNG